jgi:hypothetical protein
VRNFQLDVSVVAPHLDVIPRIANEGHQTSHCHTVSDPGNFFQSVQLADTKKVNRPLRIEDCENDAKLGSCIP